MFYFANLDDFELYLRELPLNEIKKLNYIHFIKNSKTLCDKIVSLYIEEGTFKSYMIHPLLE